MSDFPKLSALFVSFAALKFNCRLSGDTMFHGRLFTYVQNKVVFDVSAQRVQIYIV